MFFVIWVVAGKFSLTPYQDVKKACIALGKIQSEQKIVLAIGVTVYDNYAEYETAQMDCKKVMEDVK
mgnify:FL=1